jgi:hypothetical protein
MAVGGYRRCGVGSSAAKQGKAVCMSGGVKEHPVLYVALVPGPRRIYRVSHSRERPPAGTRLPSHWFQSHIRRVFSGKHFLVVINKPSTTKGCLATGCAGQIMLFSLLGRRCCISGEPTPPNDTLLAILPTSTRYQSRAPSVAGCRIEMTSNSSRACKRRSFTNSKHRGS